MCLTAQIVPNERKNPKYEMEFLHFLKTKKIRFTLLHVGLIYVFFNQRLSLLVIFVIRSFKTFHRQERESSKSNQPQMKCTGRF